MKKNLSKDHSYEEKENSASILHPVLAKLLQQCLRFRFVRPLVSSGFFPLWSAHHERRLWSPLRLPKGCRAAPDLASVPALLPAGILHCVPQHLRHENLPLQAVKGLCDSCVDMNTSRLKAFWLRELLGGGNWRENECISCVKHSVISFQQKCATVK